MDILKIREKAKKIGIELGNMGKRELIRAIQRAEGNIDCYATERVRTCGEEECLWRDDCLKAQIEDIREIGPFIIEKEAKMKLQTVYWKNADGSIKVTIKVVDQDDFPTCNIFGPTLGNPADEGWSLGESTDDSITKTLPTSDEAKQWASAQIHALKGKLDNWRSIWVPEPEEFEI